MDQATRAQWRTLLSVCRAAGQLLIIINLPLVGIWVRLLRVPYRLMFPSIVIFCAIGIYSVNISPVAVVLAGVFGLIGYYWLIKHDFEPAPRAGDLAWQLKRVRESPALCAAARDRSRTARAGSDADVARQTQRGVHGSRELKPCFRTSVRSPASIQQQSAIVVAG